MSAAPEQLQLGGEPRVDLMPSEVRDKRRGRGVRRILVLALVGSLVIVGAGYAVATVRAATAAAELQQAQARTSQLLAEQLQYAEVTQVEAARDRVVAQRQLVTSTEVFWNDFVAAVRAVLPEGAVIQSVQARGAAHDEADLGISGPLRQPRVAEVTLQVFTPGLPSATQLMRSLAKVPMIADGMPTVAAAADGGYVTTLILNAGEAALAQRFVELAEDADDGSASDDAGTENAGTGTDSTEDTEADQ